MLGKISTATIEVKLYDAGIKLVSKISVWEGSAFTHLIAPLI